MKIIEDNYHKPKEIICLKCKSKLEATVNDLESDGRDTFIVCPLCKNRYYINQERFIKF